MVEAKFAAQAARIGKVEKGIAKISTAGFPEGKGTDNEKPLIEAKQVSVPEFAGAVTDSRSKFLEWSEKVHDRVGLYSREAMEA